MAILNEGIRKAAMWAPIQFKRDRPNEDLRLPSVIIFKDNVCEMKIGVFNLKDIFNIISHKVLGWKSPFEVFFGTKLRLI